MNIFATDPCPYQSARNLDDKRVVKMCLETAQMLSTAALVLWRYEEIFDAPLLKPAYQKHPCTVWAGENTHHFYWLVQHGIALCELYTKVYGKTHKNEELIRWFTPCTKRSECLPPARFANCAANASLGLDFKYEKNTHRAYQLYLYTRWYYDKRPPTWRGRDAPKFFFPTET
jgi:hypothetical protein